MSDSESSSGSSSQENYETAMSKMFELLDGEAFDLDQESLTAEEEENSESEPESEAEAAPLINSAALDKVLAKFKLEPSFFDTQTLSYPDPLDISDANNDLQREVEFYKQSLWAANHARALFIAADKPFTRPDDYFAEMVKSDEHMERVRTSLMEQHSAIKASEEAKRQRYLKKFGKKVQVAKLQERQKEKKQAMEKVKDIKKKRKGAEVTTTGDDFDVGIEDEPAAKRARTDGGDKKRKMPRAVREKKYGRPQTSRRPKQNDKKSTNDLVSRPPRTNKGQSKQGRSKPRPGKSKRQKS